MALIASRAAILADTIASLPKRFGRDAPVGHTMMINAQALVSMAHARLCMKASPETRAVMTAICKEVEKIDPALFAILVPKCVQCGYCNELKSCGYIDSPLGKADRKSFKALFKHGK